MDVALSLATGLGLRVYLIRFTSQTSSISLVVLGLWEGILAHQFSFHPPPFVSSSPLDHYLALGLRFMIDLLIAGSWSGVKMVALWAVIGTIISESLFPSFPNSFGTSVKPSSSRRDREKRRQHSRSGLSHAPSHIRIYQEPEEPPLPLPVRAPGPRTSTPVQPTIQVDTDVARPNDQAFMSPNFPPPTPPSFFLHAEAEPSPFPDSPASPLKPTTTTTVFAQVPSRPTSALAFYEAAKPTLLAPSAGPSSRQSLLPPTPPDSTLRERTMDSRVDRLSTIDEITSRSEHVSEDIEPHPAEEEEDSTFILHGGEEPLPVPNPMSHYVRAEDGTPIVSAVPSVAPTAIPLPIPPILSRPPSDDGDELRTPGQPAYELGDSDPDELKTPPVLPFRASRNSTTSSTPVGVNESGRQVATLSPLLLDSKTIAPDQEPIPVPGTTLSSYAILQPPVAPRPLGSLLDALSSTVPRKADAEPEDLRPLSDVSDGESVLSTRIPMRLLEHAEDIRKQAVEEGKELERLKGELHKARSEHRPRDVLFLKGDIKNAEERMRKLHEKAARRFFAGHNNLQKPNTIDVHGLKPEEALQKTEQAFRDLLRDGQSTLRVVVGKGLHSKNRVPVVKNYIIEVMRNQHIPCKVDPYNTGILILTLLPTTTDHPLTDTS